MIDYYLRQFKVDLKNGKRKNKALNAYHYMVMIDSR